MAALAPPVDFVSAAVETNADAILIFSLYAQGVLDCRGFRERCIEAGIGDIPVYVGGNLLEGNEEWRDVAGRFLKLGFDRVFPPETPAYVINSALECDVRGRAGGIRRGHP
jgi:methylaspartate mutase sigma subunit